jgi:predicted nucleic acid-binding protein
LKFLDTNIFVRYLTGDDPVRMRACESLFERLDRGEEDALINDLVVAEVFYVLSGRVYRTPRDVIASRLRPLLLFKGLRLDNRAVVLDALDICEAFPHLDFEDCMAIARMHSEGIDEIYSYDHGFDRVPGIRRQEPVIA